MMLAAPPGPLRSPASDIPRDPSAPLWAPPREVSRARHRLLGGEGRQRHHRRRRHPRPRLPHRLAARRPRRRAPCRPRTARARRPGRRRLAGFRRPARRARRPRRLRRPHHPPDPPRVRVPDRRVDSVGRAGGLAGHAPRADRRRRHPPAARPCSTTTSAACSSPGPATWPCGGPSPSRADPTASCSSSSPGGRCARPTSARASARRSWPRSATTRPSPAPSTPDCSPPRLPRLLARGAARCGMSERVFERANQRHGASAHWCTLQSRTRRTTRWCTSERRRTSTTSSSPSCAGPPRATTATPTPSCAPTSGGSPRSSAPTSASGWCGPRSPASTASARSTRCSPTTTVDEVLVNPGGDIWIERDGHLERARSPRRAPTSPSSSNGSWPRSAGASTARRRSSTPGCPTARGCAP